MKSALKSRTLWFNVITAFVSLMQGPLGAEYLSNETLVLVLAVGNFVLRFLTTTAVR